MQPYSRLAGKPVLAGALVGAAYAILIRLGLELLSHGVGRNMPTAMSVAFLFLVPMSSGALSVYLTSKHMTRREWRDHSTLTVIWHGILPMLMMVLFCVLTLLEGSICIVIALPALLICGASGGVIMSWILSYYAEHSRLSVSALALLPFLVAPLEQQFYHPVQRYTVRDELHIAASPAQVWQQLYRVQAISRSELPLSLSQLMGIPLPVRADMSHTGVGAIRTSTWERQVRFEEIITHWQAEEQLAYRFQFDHYPIPSHALDQHVQLGGEYFSPLSGAYQLRPDPQEGTWLSLSTSIEDRTHFGPYSRLWGELVFHDFHKLLLQLMKRRTETAAFVRQGSPQST